MGCGCGKRTPRHSGNFVEMRTNERGMVPLSDADDCEPYDGFFAGTYFHIVGPNTEAEKLFLRQNKVDAITYSKEHGNLPITNLVSARSLCSERILAILGA